VTIQYQIVCNDCSKTFAILTESSYFIITEDGYELVYE
jgi:hypothetical protein